MVDTRVLVDRKGGRTGWTGPTKVVFEVCVWWVAGLRGGGGGGGDTGAERTS